MVEIIYSMPRVMPEYKEQARLKILEKAFIVFSKKGYHYTTMDDIASEVGVTKGTLYVYFKSKEELFRAMAGLHSSMFDEKLLKSFSNKSFKENYGLFFDLYVRMNSGNEPLIYELASLSTRNNAVKKMLQFETEESERRLIAFFTQQVNNGYLPEETDLEKLSVTICLLMEGLMERIFFGLSKKDAKNIWIETITKIIG
ncbi:transcriptional regulator, TetR family [Methanolacinia petrolearia DSM 11571]|uniref:Transcriptional regulator, TetR family n=1 Tax=Methanolacinia petrolearia (strain DSM 11571 / OCM 486 / SEBR 4847) TaxID=679926 RepID=E1RKK4_METP4|nr:TetR/AcrR family transcriptional regulator [Methanolacinia petrolearia]ADN35857.1 transcriptional regulator, TetR family [Methanolacinia petrolearia DSM 11571]